MNKQITRAELQELPLEDVVKIASERIGGNVSLDQKRSQAALMFVALLLKGEVVSDEELRETLSEDSSRIVHLARQEFNIPIRTLSRHTPYARYSMHPEEIELFLNPETRKAQASSLKDSRLNRKHRLEARQIARVYRRRGEVVPDWVEELLKQPIPNIRSGRSLPAEV